MTPKKWLKIFLLNLGIAMANIIVFSKAFLGLSLIAGSTLAMTTAWFTLLASCGGFFYFNNKLLTPTSTYTLIAEKIHSIDDCVGVFEEAIKNGDVFDEDILKNLDQIKRYKRKRKTINEILDQKFSPNEITHQKFKKVLDEVEEVMYLNMRSILNKMAAFDVEEYESLQKKGFPANEVSEEKMNIYNEYIYFVKSATKTNEDILLKLDKVLLEISRYNSIENGDIKNLPAIVEMDELIKNAKLYK
jgi:hypothetical protein